MRLCTSSAFAFAFALALVHAACATRAHAQYLPRDDPYAYGLRITLFPAIFQGGFSQIHFGSAARAEVDLSRRFVLAVAGRLPWAAVGGNLEPLGYSFRAGVAFNFMDEIQSERLFGTVTPADTPAVGERAGLEFGMGPQGERSSVTEKLGSGRFGARDRDLELFAPIRNVQSLRIGYDLVRGIQQARPNLPDYVSTMHAFYVGYSFSLHWNLSPATAGEREIGWRRYYLDLMVTAEPLIDAEPLVITDATRGRDQEIFAGGLRIGMEGAIEAIQRSAPGLGFGYDIELGLLPGASGFEAYLFIGLGLAVDAIIRG